MRAPDVRCSLASLSKFGGDLCRRSEPVGQVARPPRRLLSGQNSRARWRVSPQQIILRDAVDKSEFQSLVGGDFCP